MHVCISVEPLMHVSVFLFFVALECETKPQTSLDQTAEQHWGSWGSDWQPREAQTQAQVCVLWGEGLCVWLVVVVVVVRLEGWGVSLWMVARFTRQLPHLGLDSSSQQQGLHACCRRQREDTCCRIERICCRDDHKGHLYGWPGLIA